MDYGQMDSGLRAQVKEYKMPPFRDALVLGREASIGCQAMRRALALLMKIPFAHIELDDAVIADILIRENLLRRVSKEQLIAFVLTHIKPLMGADEALQIDLDVEVTVAASAK